MNEEWFTKLANLSCLADGPVKAREYLSSSGIPVVFEPHLQKTYLDGAVFLLTHDWCYQAGRPDDVHQVDIHPQVPVVVGDIQQRALGAMSRAIDQSIDLSKTIE